MSASGPRLQLRQAQQEGYTLQQGGPGAFQQGDLTAAAYFDFISFAQWATISAELSSPQHVFTELNGADGEATTVRRDQALNDDSVLPAALATEVGEALLDGLTEFEGVAFGGPTPCAPPATAACLLQRLQTLLDALLRGGFALRAELLPARQSAGGRQADEASSSGGERAESPLAGFTLRLEGPANLWSCAALAARGAMPNDYAAFAAAALLRRSGVRGFSFSSRVIDGGTATSSVWTLTQPLA